MEAWTAGLLGLLGLLGAPIAWFTSDYTHPAIGTSAQLLYTVTTSCSKPSINIPAMHGFSWNCQGEVSREQSGLRARCVKARPELCNDTVFLHFPKKKQKHVKFSFFTFAMFAFTRMWVTTWLCVCVCKFYMLAKASGTMEAEPFCLQSYYYNSRL